MVLNDSAATKTISLPENIEGEIRIILSWTKDNEAGFFQRMFRADKVDLDLGCYYELTNGNRTLIDCLQFAGDAPAERSCQSKQGCYDKEPYIWHTGDNPGTENTERHIEEILVNPAGLCHIKRITAYSYIFDGPASWDVLGASIALQIPGCDPIEVPLKGDGSRCRFCAAMQIDFDHDSRTVMARKLGTLHTGHSDCDQAYGWGLRFRQA